jgi:hypothetical protein
MFRFLKTALLVSEVISESNFMKLDFILVDPIKIDMLKMRFHAQSHRRTEQSYP